MGREEDWGAAEFAKDMAEIRPFGRNGMLESDHYSMKFQTHAIPMWSTKEIRNRLNWLRKRKFAGLKDTHKQTITTEKIAKYAKALFDRESVEGQAKTQAEFNRKRRNKRATAKTKRLRELAKAAQIRLREKMRAMKSLTSPQPQPSSNPA